MSDSVEFDMDVLMSVSLDRIPGVSEALLNVLLFCCPWNCDITDVVFLCLTLKHFC